MAVAKNAANATGPNQLNAVSVTTVQSVPRSLWNILAGLSRQSTNVIAEETTKPVSSPTIDASFHVRACIQYYRNSEYSTVRFGSVAVVHQFITWAAGIGQKRTFARGSAQETHLPETTLILKTIFDVRSAESPSVISIRVSATSPSLGVPLKTCLSLSKPSHPSRNSRLSIDLAET